tara:strand:- start:340 stop:972 length:633 start_codon:yes stop_codon:yes gene_type:complete
MHKRIGKELRDIIPSRLNEQNLIYDAYKCDYYYENNHINSESIKIDILNRNTKYIILQINVPKCYPFKAPSATFSPYNNPINYNRLLANNSNNQKFSRNNLFSSLFFSICYNPHFYKTSLFSHLTLINSCFCCSSITCQNNWHPGLVISDIVKEYCLFKTFKKYRMNQYLRIFDKLFHRDECNFPDEIILFILEKIGDPIDNNIIKVNLN